MVVPFFPLEENRLDVKSKVFKVYINQNTESRNNFYTDTVYLTNLETIINDPEAETFLPECVFPLI